MGHTLSPAMPANTVVEVAVQSVERHSGAEDLLVTRLEHGCSAGGREGGGECNIGGNQMPAATERADPTVVRWRRVRHCREVGGRNVTTDSQ